MCVGRIAYDAVTPDSDPGSSLSRVARDRLRGNDGSVTRMRDRIDEPKY